MIKDYRLDDIKESADGDLTVFNGDLGTVDNSKLENLTQYIRTILSTPLDNIFFPELGFDPSNFVGMPNTEETANILKDTITMALIRDGYISRDSISVDVFPVSNNEVAIILSARSITDDNHVQTIRLNIVFDYMTGRVLTLRG